jgi:hypothetical protein
MNSSRRLRLFGLTTFYGLLAFLALHRLLLHPQTVVAGQGVTDFYHFTWSYWWVEQALTQPHLDLYQTNYVIAPYTSNLAFHTLALFWFPLWWLFKTLLGPLGAFSAIAWVAFTLTGSLTYWLLRRERISIALALWGGVLFQFTPLMMMAVWWTTPNLLGQFWYPIHLLLWGTITRRAESLRRALPWVVLQGLGLWAAALTDLQYLLFLALLLVPYGLWTLWESPWRGRLIAYAGLIIALAITLLYLIGPLAAMLEFDRSKSVKADAGMVWGIEFPDGFLRVGEYWQDNAVGGLITLVVLLTLGRYVWLARYRQALPDKRAMLWGIVMLLPLILALGYEINIGGQIIRLPYGYLHEPLGGTFRAPGRFGPIAVLAALLMIGLSWRIPPKASLWVVPLGLWLVLAHHHILQPFPTQSAPPDYTLYHDMAQEPYDYVVIEVPVAVGDALATVGQPDDLLPQYYGAIHGKRMVTGHLSRAYLEYYWYLRTDDPLLSWLGQRRLVEPSLVEPQLADLIPAWPIGYFVIRQNAIGLETTTNPEIIGYFNSLPHLLCPPIVEGPLVAFRTTWHPDGCPNRLPAQVAPNEYLIDIGASSDERFLGWGWYWVERPPGINWRWAGLYPSADLYLELPKGDYLIEVAAQAFWQANRLQLSLNGQLLGEQVIVTDTLATYCFNAPAATLAQGEQIVLSLLYDAPIIPAEVGQSPDQRSLSIAVDWIRFQLVD